MANDSVISYPLGPCKNDTEALQFIEDMTSNSDAVQERVLAEILSQNAETEYLQRFGLNGATDRESFKSKIPIITYDDLHPDIQCIANGDRSPILSSHPISEFLTRKLMLTIAKEMDRRQKSYNLLMPVMKLFVAGLDKGKALYFLFGKDKPMCEPWEVSYAIVHKMGYFEFIPHHPSAPPPSRESPPLLVDMADVEVGKEYELVVSTYSGLSRYQVGDILQVMGFYNSAPQFRFVRRKNVLLSIYSDKIDEAELKKAVENASILLRKFNTSVVEYTCHVDTKTIPEHYVIYWVLMARESASLPTDDVLNQCCLAMEESLNSVYRQVADRSIGPLEIRVVKNGTFELLMDYAISRGGSINRYKVPRCAIFKPILEQLDSMVVSVHFSQAELNWTPEQRC